MSGKVRVTVHSGRYNKKTGQAYSNRHNDRNYPNERKNEFGIENITWHRLNGFDEYHQKKFGREPTFEDVEKYYYEKHFGKWLKEDNEKKVKQGHAGRQRKIENILENKKTAPQETILQIGNKDHKPETKEEQLDWGNRVAEMSLKYIERVIQRFPQYKPINYAVHMDEESIHVHERGVFIAIREDGTEYPHQRDALLQMGVERPDPDKERGQWNNEKMTFTEECRQIWQELTREYFPEFELDVKPERPGKRSMDLIDYQIERVERGTEKFQKFYAEHDGTKTDERGGIWPSDVEVEIKNGLQNGDLAVSDLPLNRQIELSQEMQQELTQKQERVRALEAKISDLKEQGKDIYPKTEKALKTALRELERVKTELGIEAR